MHPLLVNYMLIACLFAIAAAKYILYNQEARGHTPVTPRIIMIRYCVVCSRAFSAPPSSKKVTCSPDCSRIRKRQAHLGVSNRWSDAARARLAAAGRTPNLCLGTPAAQKSPIAGRYETNQEAKVWRLVDPVGNEIVVRNLLMWARANTCRFGKPAGDKSARQIAAGFKAVAQTLRGTRKTPASTYMGWTLNGAPQYPDPGAHSDS